MKFAITLLVIALAGVGVFAQSPTLRIVTDDPNLPSELFYGNVKVKPLRVRPGTNPPQLITIDDSDFFVQQQYVDFLNRMPDASGFGFWNSNITNCGSNAACIDNARVNTSAAFYLSIEFQTTGYLVERMYKSSYGSNNGTSTFGGTHTLQVPIVKFSEFIPDTKQIGVGLIVGQTGWEAVLEANKQSFANAFVQRSRFTSAFPTSLSPTTFVNTLSPPHCRRQLLSTRSSRTPVSLLLQQSWQQPLASLVARAIPATLLRAPRPCAMSPTTQPCRARNSIARLC